MKNKYYLHKFEKTTSTTCETAVNLEIFLFRMCATHYQLTHIGRGNKHLNSHFNDF